MPRDKSDLIHLADMLAFAREVVAFTENRSFEDFLGDTLLRRAVEHSVQLIGEAAKRVSPEFESMHPQIPWNRIIVQRHRIVHEYDRIDAGIVWSVAMKYVPQLIELIEPMLPPLPPDTEAEQLGGRS